MRWHAGLLSLLVVGLVVVGLAAMHVLGHPTGHGHDVGHLPVAQPVVGVSFDQPDPAVPFEGLDPAAVCLTVLVAGFALVVLIRSAGTRPPSTGVAVTRLLALIRTPGRSPPCARRLAQLSVLRI